MRIVRERASTSGSSIISVNSRVLIYTDTGYAIPTVGEQKVVKQYHFTSDQLVGFVLFC